ncbi:MAG: hypothetical protein QXN51_05125 [Ignisphaera sp.]
MVAVECFWQERDDGSGKDFVCAIHYILDYKIDVLVVIMKDYIQILYDSNDKYTSNIEYIAMECNYIEVKTNDNRNIIRCVML